MSKTEAKKQKWYSNGVKVSATRESSGSNTLFIVEQENGKFHPINADYNWMRERYPEN